MKKLPVDVSHFQTMITDGYLYVDKTKIIHQLITSRRLFFLSRPRRFGKSLLISTLKELLAGNKELFKDTWIGQKSDYKWEKHPIIQLDFSLMSVETSTEFKLDFAGTLEDIAEKNGIDLRHKQSIQAKLLLLVRELSKKNKVVILIDEYDRPLLQNLDNLPTAKSILKIMSSFYATIKALDGAGLVQTLFITGVTKFAKTTIFSGMNNLTDLTVHESAATLLGYTQDELHSYFAQYAPSFAQKKKLTIKQLFDRIKQRYNGYRFSPIEQKVYNPYSVLHSFADGNFNNYWLDTGTPTFLVALLKKQFPKIEQLHATEMSSEALGNFNIEKLHIIPILFQAGYLTIHNFDEKTGKFLLGFPNTEVEDSFYKYLVVALAQSSIPDVELASNDFIRALDQNDIELFCTTLTSLIASIPYQLHIAKESYYHSLLHFLTTLLGIESESEISSSKGRIDLVIKSKKRIYLFEFKFNSTAKKALDQIIKNRYYEKYLRFKKPIILIGLAFNPKKKMATLDWIVQPYTKKKTVKK